MTRRLTASSKSKNGIARTAKGSKSGNSVGPNFSAEIALGSTWPVKVIAAELERYLPFLATTNFLMAAVKSGVGREAAHEIIKSHATKAALEMREGKANNLIAAIASDARIPLDAAALTALIKDPIEFTGDARQQIARVVNRIDAITSAHSAAAQYKPGSIR